MFTDRIVHDQIAQNTPSDLVSILLASCSKVLPDEPWHVVKLDILPEFECPFLWLIMGSKTLEEEVNTHFCIPYYVLHRLSNCGWRRKSWLQAWSPVVPTTFSTQWSSATAFNQDLSSVLLKSKEIYSKKFYLTFTMSDSIWLVTSEKGPLDIPVKCHFRLACTVCTS